MTRVTKITRQQKGKPILASTLASLADTANEKPIAGPKQSDSKGNAPTAKAFKIISEEGDYLVCLPLRAGLQEIASNYVNVAKNWESRRTPFDGATWNSISYVYSSNSERVATSGDSETQVIVPSYVANQEIRATRIIGGTGVTDSAGGPVLWEDENRGGRAWAKKST